MSNPLFKKKPMDWLLNEAKATGEHTLKRTLGPVSLRPWEWAQLSAREFSYFPPRRALCRPGLMLSFVISGLGCALRGFAMLNSRP